MNPRLRDISSEGQNQYCGPAVLSALTGKTTDECADVIRRVNGQRYITAVQVADLMQALRLLKFTCTEARTRSYSLYGSISELINNPGMYVVVVPRHVVAVEITEDKQAYFVDNHTKKVINAAAAARLGQKLTGIYKVEPAPAPKHLETKYDVTRSVTANGITRILLFKNEIWSDIDYNTSTRLAILEYKDADALDRILKELNEGT